MKTNKQGNKQNPTVTVNLFLLCERRACDGSSSYRAITWHLNLTVNGTDILHIRTPQIIALCNDIIRKIKEFQGRCYISLLIYQLPLIYMSPPYSSDVSFYSGRWTEGWISIAGKGSVHCCFLWVNCLQLKRGTAGIGIWLDPTDFSRTKLRQFALSSPLDIQGWQACKTYYTLLNLKNRYWQVRLDEESSELYTSVHPGADTCFSIYLLK